MQTNDIINATFELTGGLLLFINCWRIYKDKQVKGYSIIPLLVFVLWGYYNLYFYPSVGAIFSFYAAISVVFANTIYLGQILYYRHVK